MASSSAGSPTMAAGIYLDQFTLKASISRMTIPQIKPLIKETHHLTGAPMPNIGNLRKAELVEILCNVFKRLHDERRTEDFAFARRLLEARYGSTIQPYRPTSDQVHHRPMNSYHPGANPGVMNRLPHNNYSMPQNPNANHYTNLQASLAQRSSEDINTRFGAFKESPFYKLKEWIRPARLCPQAPANQRQSGSEKLAIHFTTEQCQLLQSTSKPLHQARLFCTTLAASRAALNPRHPAPVEFPINCEVRVNRIQLSGNLRGKKTPAKVLPPDINKDKKLDLRMGRNEVELSYIGTYQPYLMTIGICEYISPDDLTERVKREHVKSKQEVLKEMKKAADDDDIEVGDVTINLKCPLSYMRLNTPCRSNVCAHIQCFDALSFYSVNEQTPSWQCPICSRIIDPESIFVDGYVLDILQKVPDSEESVHIDGEGRWRTPNNKYRSEDQSLKTESNGKAIETQIQGEIPGAGSSNRDLHEDKSLPRVKGEAEEMQTLVPPARPATPSGEQGSSNGSSLGKKRTIEVVDLDDSPSPPRKAQKSSTLTNGKEITPQTGNNTTITECPNGFSTPSITNNVSASASNALRSPNPYLQPPPAARASVIDLTLSDSEDEDIPLRDSSVNRLTTSRPPGVRPPSFPPRAPSLPQRPPSLPQRPPSLPPRPHSSNPQQPLIFLSGIPAEEMQAGIARMPLPPAPRHLGKGMQSIVQFLVPKEGSNQNDRRSPAVNSVASVTLSRPSNGGQSTLSRSASTPSATTNSDSRAGSSGGRLYGSFFEEHSPATGLGHSPSFAGSSTGPTYASGLFGAPASPSQNASERRANVVTPPDMTEEPDAPPSSQTQESQTADEAPMNGRNVNDEDDEDPIRTPHKRSRPAISFDQNSEEDEFADSELDQLDLDPDAGLGGGSFSVQNKDDVGNANGNVIIDHTKENGNSERINDGSSTFVPSSDDNPSNRRSGLTSDDEFQADERAGLGGG